MEVCAYVSHAVELCVAVPLSGFTQRATLDPQLNEIHVLTVSNVTQMLLKCY